MRLSVSVYIYALLTHMYPRFAFFITVLKSTFMMSTCCCSSDLCPPPSIFPFSRKSCHLLFLCFFVCVRACVRACVRVCVRACVCVCVSPCTRACLRVLKTCLPYILCLIFADLFTGLWGTRMYNTGLRCHLQLCTCCLQLCKTGIISTITKGEACCMKHFPVIHISVNRTCFGIYIHI